MSEKKQARLVERCPWCALFDSWGRRGWCFILASEVGNGDWCPEFRRFLREGSGDGSRYMHH